MRAKTRGCERAGFCFRVRLSSEFPYHLTSRRMSRIGLDLIRSRFLICRRPRLARTLEEPTQRVASLLSLSRWSEHNGWYPESLLDQRVGMPWIPMGTSESPDRRPPLRLRPASDQRAPALCTAAKLPPHSMRSLRSPAQS